VAVASWISICDHGCQEALENDFDEKMSGKIVLPRMLMSGK